MLENSNRLSILFSNTNDFHEARIYFYYYTAMINGINDEDESWLQNYEKADLQYRLLENIDKGKPAVRPYHCGKFRRDLSIQ